eukprot:CAMPEP_0119310642 /NCGR_PEP_ID=MMETSP1333-20130426/19687_1 /TAXON_ID=418940 /ORGANISM="Scyphosphaera apsteinii, Strain RCC1455" /LENGTH=363 /DNA_ID=CAMNT_0007314861 /DNA_START=124 /DNA_END=1215 /DNA_ORIENTATION=-
MDKPTTVRPYIRDYNDLDKPGVNLTLLENLISERAVLRAKREYEAADMLKAVIQSMGATLVDRPGREAWYLTPRYDRSERRDEQDVTDSIGSAQNGRGHGYQRMGGPMRGAAARFPMWKVDRLLGERETALQASDTEKAAELLDQLHEAGISLCDVVKRWRGDGLCTFTSDYARIAGDGDDEFDDKAAVAVLVLLEERTNAKRRQNYLRADEIARELRTVHSVVVDDARRSWRVVKQSGGFYRVGPKVGKAEAKIIKLLQALGTAGQEGDSVAGANAAAVTRTLSRMGVQLNEQQMTWRRPLRTREELEAAASRKAQRSRGRARKGRAASVAKSRGKVEPTILKGGSVVTVQQGGDPFPGTTP